MARKKKGKRAGFSVVAAVKRNARERLGQPKPARVLTDKPAAGVRESKYRRSQADGERGEEE